MDYRDTRTAGSDIASGLVAAFVAYVVVSIGLFLFLLWLVLHALRLIAVLVQWLLSWRTSERDRQVG